MSIEDIRAAVLERVKQEGVQAKPASPIPAPSILDCLHANEVGDAELFTWLWRDLLIFDHAANQWYRWAGHWWGIDSVEHAAECVQEVTRQYSKYLESVSAKINDARRQNEPTQALEATEKALRKRITELQTRRRIENVLALAKIGDSGLSTSGESWDRDPWAFACASGVIDLKTGEIHPGNPRDMIRLHTTIHYPGVEAPCPIWDRFLSDIFGADQELVEFVHCWAGYTMTGVTDDAVFPILWGAGRNGKTVFAETIKHVMGGYAATLPTETIIQSRTDGAAGGPRSDLIALYMLRLLIASEINENKSLNPGAMKMLTGGDSITARPPYGKRQVTWRPTHKIALLTNHRPRVPASDSASWARVMLIPFEIRFVDDPNGTNERIRDPAIQAKLQDEAPSILAWLVRGCLLWQFQQGLHPPEKVLVATEAYREQNDILRDFIDECCDVMSHAKTQFMELYRAYIAFCASVGSRHISTNRFKDLMDQKFDSISFDRKTFYTGIILK